MIVLECKTGDRSASDHMVDTLSDHVLDFRYDRELLVDDIEVLYTVELDAVDPMELLREATPDGIWVRLEHLEGPGGGHPVVRVRGSFIALREYVDTHWDLKNLPRFEELIVG